MSGPVASQSVTRDGAGRYRLEGLVPGDYTVRAAAPSFQPADRRVEVAASGAAGADFRLALAPVSESVSVTSAWRAAPTP